MSAGGKDRLTLVLDLPKRLFGLGRSRFLLQPAMAVALGIAAGRADARAGRAPYPGAALFAARGNGSSVAEKVVGALVGGQCHSVW